MMGAFQNKADFQRYEEPAAEVFRAEVKKIMPLQEAVKYVVALDKRKLLWELLPHEIEKNAAMHGVRRPDALMRTKGEEIWHIRLHSRGMKSST